MSPVSHTDQVVSLSLKRAHIEALHEVTRALVNYADAQREKIQFYRHLMAFSAVVMTGIGILWFIFYFILLRR